MPRRYWRAWFGVVLGLLAGSTARGQGPAQPGFAGGPAMTMEQIVRMSPEALDALYAQGVATAIPAGRVKGHHHIKNPESTPMSNLLFSLLEKMDVRVDKVGDSNGSIAI